MAEDRLSKQIEFLVEIDRLKTVFRNARLIADPDRKENSAEHSWHTAMMALILDEYAEDSIDSSRLIKMMLIHDVIEVDAGDTNIYDGQAAKDKESREKKAAGRIYGILPNDQGQEMLGLWSEFEEGITPESKFARALDRLIPLIHNYYTQGKRWKEDGITYKMALPVYQNIQENCPALWEFTVSMINDCVSKGYFAKG